MRLSTTQIFSNALKGISSAQEAVTKTQEQIASNKRILTPADDPVAAERVLQINNDIALTDQYQRNVDFAEQKLSLEETTLTSISDIVISLKELAVKAGDGVLTFTDRKQIAVEVQQRVEDLAGLMNSTGLNGEYLFSGFQELTEPYARTANGSYAYLGDDGQSFMQIASGRQIAANDSGQAVFETIASSNNTFITSASASNTAAVPAIISVGRVVDQVTYDSFYPDDMVITFDNPASTFTVTQKSDGSVIAAAQPYTSGAAIQIQGVEITITGAPAVGDSFFIDSSSTQSLLRTVDWLGNGLQQFDDTTTGRADLATLLDNTLANLDKALDKILSVRTDIGARLNTLEDTLNEHLDTAIIQNAALSDVQDLDYTEAISRLSFQSFILEAAQQSFLKVSQLSLFNFLR